MRKLILCNHYANGGTHDKVVVPPKNKMVNCLRCEYVCFSTFPPKSLMGIHEWMAMRNPWFMENIFLIIGKKSRNA